MILRRCLNGLRQLLRQRTAKIMSKSVSNIGHPALALQLQGRCLIEASAGTGKTWSIAKLFVRALFERNLLPKQVLVVTFTNAATKELRERLYLELLDVEDWLQRCVQSSGLVNHVFYTPWATSFYGDSFDASKLLAWVKRCIHSFDEAAISTLQGFCEAVVKRHASEMGIELVASAFETSDAGNARDARMPSESSSGMLLEVAAVYMNEVSAMNAMPLREAAFIKVAVGKYSDVLQCVQSLLNKPATLPPLETRSLDEQRRVLLASGILAAYDTYSKSVNDQHISEFIAYGNRYMAKPDRLKSIKSVQFNDIVLALKELSALGTIESKDWSRLKRIDSAGRIGNSKVSDSDAASALALVQAAREYFEQYFAFEKLADDYRQQVVLTAFYAAKKALLDGNNLSFANTSLSYTRTVQLAALGLSRYTDVAMQLQQRFPIALIDEFQDTDPTQAVILNAIYPEPSNNQNQRQDYAVVMVGDPKQAIYNFRGADVYAYLNAKNSAEQIFSLDTNQRSVAPLVDEVNALFSAMPDVFDVPGIDFVAMKESGKHTSTLAPPAFCYCAMPASKSDFDVWQWVAKEVESLLRGALIKPQDIAVLVSSNKNALFMRDALTALGLQSRVEDKTSIWVQPIAKFLLWFLQGVHLYTDSPSLKKAILTPMGGQICQRLFALDELQDLSLVRAVNDSLLSEFARLKGVWLAQGFAAFWQEAFPTPAIDSDLRHLLELLNLRVSTQVAPPHDIFGLIQWFEAQVNKSSRASLSEETNRRRSISAGAQVQISTIHASKGLQYEVVFLPDLIGKSDPRAGRITYFEKDMKLAADLSSAEFQTSEVSLASDREQEREELRLAYVALTRAVQACFVVVPSALVQPPVKKTKAKVDRRLTALVRSRISALQSIGSHLLTLIESDRSDETHSDIKQDIVSSDKVDESQTTAALMPALVELPRSQIAPAWVIDSFTALARRSANENHSLQLGDSFDYTDSSVLNLGSKAAQVAIEFDPHFGHNIEALPKGARTGECLHAILENTRWQTSLAEGANLAEVQKQTLRYDIAHNQSPELALWLDDVLQTPLVNGFALRDISPNKMIREWRFDNLQAMVADGKPNAYLRGYVDLVFEHQNKFYIIDYKSNWLGAGDEAYGAEAIKRSMQEHHYDLQAKIYSAALKNFLASRIGAAKVQDAYGGVLYLYLRAMKSSAPSFGVMHVA
jgi:exodeoxyribonuclease V beta subunit